MYRGGISDDTILCFLCCNIYFYTFIRYRSEWCEVRWYCEGVTLWHIQYFYQWQLGNKTITWWVLCIPFLCRQYPNRLFFLIVWSDVIFWVICALWAIAVIIEVAILVDRNNCINSNIVTWNIALKELIWKPYFIISHFWICLLSSNTRNALLSDPGCVVWSVSF